MSWYMSLLYLILVQSRKHLRSNMQYMHARMVTLLSFPVNKVCQLGLGFHMVELHYKNASAATKESSLIRIDNPTREHIVAAIGTRHQSNQSFSSFLVCECILSMMSVPIL